MATAHSGRSKRAVTDLAGNPALLLFPKRNATSFSNGGGALLFPFGGFWGDGQLLFVWRRRTNLMDAGGKCPSWSNQFWLKWLVILRSSYLWNVIAPVFAQMKGLSRLWNSLQGYIQRDIHACARIITRKAKTLYIMKAFYKAFHYHFRKHRGFCRIAF